MPQQDGVSENVNKKFTKGKLRNFLVGTWLISFLASMVYLAYFVWFSDIGRIIEIRDLVLIGISGGLGGGVYCARKYYSELYEFQSVNSTAWYFVLRPLLSIIVGAFSYFIVNGGVMIIGTQPAEQSALMFFASLSFIIGIAFSRFMEKIYQVSEVIFTSKNNNEKKENQPIL